MVDADWFITGHQPCDDGFRQANHRQIIIDGTDPYPAYCLFPATRAGDHRVAAVESSRVIGSWSVLTFWVRFPT